MEIKPTYKEIVNYLRNELEITRDYIKEVVELSIANSVKQAINERLTDGRLDREIANAVRIVTTDGNRSFNKESSKEAFASAVKEETKKQVGKILAGDFNVEFSISPKNKNFHAAAVAQVLNGNSEEA